MQDAFQTPHENVIRKRTKVNKNEIIEQRLFSGNEFIDKMENGYETIMVSVA